MPIIYMRGIARQMAGTRKIHFSSILKPGETVEVFQFADDQAEDAASGDEFVKVGKKDPSLKGIEQPAQYADVAPPSIARLLGRKAS